jgi:hypothetical protein
MQSCITNLTAQRRFFGFLPPHGVSLAAGETRLFDGDFRTVLASGRNRYGRPIELASFDRALAAGVVAYGTIEDPPCSSSSSSSSSSSP